MTYSRHDKVMTQIGHKPSKLARHKKYNVTKQRKFGKKMHECRRCGRTAAHNQKYGLKLCRQCFREIASQIGFKKYS